MLIDKINIDLYIIDKNLIAKISYPDNSQWLQLNRTIAGFKVYNFNKQSTHYVILNKNNKPVNCGCEYNIFNEDVCKHILTVGKYIQEDPNNINIINSFPEDE